MRYLIIDNSNLFIRNYVVNPTLNKDGYPSGGIVGTLKSIQKIVRLTKPDKIIIVYDGAGGSQKRRTINKQYKQGRKPLRLNRQFQLNENEERQNNIQQMTRLGEYYDLMPIYQVIIEGVEADDVIAFLCQTHFMELHQKIVYSSDKDFIQLLHSDKTLLYRPIKDEILNTKRIVEQYKIHPTNFALARSIAGDKGDNIEGVSGIGLSTVANRFSFLSKNKSYTIPELVDFAQEKVNEGSKLKAYENLVREQQKIVENYKITQLYSPSISIQSKQMIQNMMENKELIFNKTKLLSMMAYDGLGEWNWDELYYSFNRILLNERSS